MRGTGSAMALAIGFSWVVLGCGQPATSDPESVSSLAGRGGSTAGVTGGSGGSGATGGTSDANGGATSAGGARTVCGRAAPNPAPGATDLVPGVWTDITPPDTVGSSFSAIAIDPSNPLTMYAGINWEGLWKTTDGGKSWRALGSGSDADPWDLSTSYFDDASSLAVDPDDPEHLYISKGVDGNDLGFWVSTNGGESWTRPAAFPPENTTTDVTAMAVDPCDFRHVLLGSHGWWATDKAGLMESTDGGQTWRATPPTFPAGSLGLSFLRGPNADLADGKTWLVIANGFWRTTDSGENWTKVSDAEGVHGSAETYYTSDGVLYAGGLQHPNRSTDNGLSWSAIPDVPYSGYYTIGGDGESIFVQPDGYPPGTGYFTSSDGLTWQPYTDSTKPSRGPLQIRFDAVNRILYSANWEAGLWALKLP